MRINADKCIKNKEFDKKEVILENYFNNTSLFNEFKKNETSI